MKAKFVMNLKISLLSIFFFQFQFGINGQGNIVPNNSDSIFPTMINELLSEGIEKEMIPGISVSLYLNDSIHYFDSGLASLNPKEKVSNKTRFQLASVGKLLTALAVLQEVDKGKLDLHTDVSEYANLEGVKFSSFDNPITLHCLLTHSCGFNDVNIGYMAKDKASLVSLEEFISQYYPGTYQEPGNDIAYSNYSYALAGLIVEKVSGKRFEQYVEDNIFTSLGMTNSTLSFPFGYKSDPNYAKGYKSKDGEFEEVEYYSRHAIPAGSLVSTSQDMALFIKALFNQDQYLLSSNSWKLFFTQHFTNHSLLNGYSYGLEQQNINGHITWAKGGMLPGALSHIVIVPNKFAIFSVTNTSDDEFGEYFYKSLLDKSLPDISKLKSKRNISTTKYTGEYRDKRYSRNTEENIVSLFRGQFNIYENKTSDTLVVYHNGEWHSYIPIEEGVFQNASLPYEHIVFKENDKGEIENMYRNLNIGGLTIPTSYEKMKWYNSPTFINEYYGIIPIFIFTGLLFMLVSIFIRIIQIWKKNFFKSKKLPLNFHILFGATMILHVVYTNFVPWQILKNSQEFLFGYPDTFRLVSLLGYLMIPFLIGLGVLIWKFWKDRMGSLFSRLYLSLVEILLIIHLSYLYYWSFL